MRESEAWRMIEKAWREAPADREREVTKLYYLDLHPDLTVRGLCLSAYVFAQGHFKGGVNDLCHFSMRWRLQTIPDTEKVMSNDDDVYYWPLTAEYDSIRADWCAKFAEQCEKEEQEACPAP